MEGGVGTALSGHVYVITGATGYVGGQVLEQLLRCAQPKAVHVLIRGKRGASAQQRLANLLAMPQLAPSHAARAAAGWAPAADVVHCLEGDLSALADGSLALPANTDVVVHSAADIRLNPPIKEVLATDCQASDTLAAAAARLPGLKAFVHVSTAFVGSSLPNGSRVAERIEPLADPAGGSGELSLSAARALADSLLAMPEQAAHAEAKRLRKLWGFPNTYTMAKSLAERVLAERAQRSGLPLAIVRPTLVCGLSLHHPLPGYVGNPSGVASYAIGISIRMCNVTGHRHSSIVDPIPGDYVSSAILLAAAEMLLAPPGGQPRAPRIVHAGSSGTNPMQGGALYALAAAKTVAEPPAFQLFSSPPPDDPWCPPGLKFKLRMHVAGRRVAMVTLALTLIGQRAAARKLQMGWKAYKVASSRRLDFNLTFENPGLQALAAAAAAAPDADAFRCTVPAGEPWEPYLQVILDGIWERYVSKFSPQKRGSDVAGASGSREAPAAASAPEPPRPALKRTLTRSMGRTLTRSMSVVLAETREPLSRAISLRHSHGAQLLERMAGLGGDADEEAGAS